MTFCIAGTAISPDQPPYLVAELSGNHQGRIENAFKMIEAAKAAGADAVKLQTYRADTMTLDHDGPGFLIEEGLWKGRKLFDLYSEAFTPWEWHKQLFEYSSKIGISIFSSPFDKTSIELLESLDCPVYKIASFELVDITLIEAAAQTGKPLIMSTGMASLEEIREAVTCARAAGAKDIVLLQCTSAYPTPYTACHLSNLSYLRKEFDVLVGLSDHTQGIIAPIAAVAQGACLIEKHFTLSREARGVDAAFSLEPHEFRDMAEACRHAWEAIGEIKFESVESEDGSRKYRRSLYVVEDMKGGEVFTESNIRSIRPGFGLHTRHYKDVLGKSCKQDISKGTPLNWDLVNKS